MFLAGLQSRRSRSRSLQPAQAPIERLKNVCAHSCSSRQTARYRLMDVLGARRLGAGEFRLNLFYLGIFATSLLLSFFLTRTVRQFCDSKAWVAVPYSVRGAHRAPVAKLGGAAIFSAFMVTIVIALLANWLTGGFLPELPKQTLGWILLLSSMIFALGIWQDMRPVKPTLRFAIQA